MLSNGEENNIRCTPDEGGPGDVDAGPSVDISLGTVSDFNIRLNKICNKLEIDD